jgi:hypothetical protein
MGRAIWIYQVDPSKTNGLRAILEDATRFKQSFAAFVKDRQHQFGEWYEMDFDNILNAISDAYQVTPALLFELIYWMSEVCGVDSEAVHDMLAEEAGMTLLYESSTKSEANCLMIFWTFSSCS